MRRRAIALVGVVALLANLLGSAVSAAPAPTTPTASLQAAPMLTAASKLRGDLATLVAGEATLDPRIPPLVAGYRPGEIPYFVLLTEPKKAQHRAALEGIGLRVLRDYHAVEAFAVASSAANVLRAAALPWVRSLAPIEIVVALDGPEPYGDQTRSTPGDLGAPSQWDAGVTGQGIRIAILDTGIDPSHPDLDDQDFRSWSTPLDPLKVVEMRNFVGGQCVLLAGVQDGHGHGTHVAGIAAGTGEGLPTADDNGRHAGIAPDAELAVAKVLTDAGAGVNSDLIAAMEWAATPPSAAPLGCGVGAQIVNLSLGSESRPQRLNTGSDIDMVSLALNRLAVRYGTLFVVAAGNSGPFIGSQLESPGAAAQALSVGATAKDYDLNHDDTYSGDPCAGYQHPSDPPSFADNTCDQGDGDQPTSLSSLSSRGPPGDLWLKPDIVAPGYYIVSAQAAGAAPIAGQDINPGTRLDPLYATASGTSMAAPATAGSAALLLEAYRTAYGGALPTGASGNASLPTAPSYALMRAALMNTATSDLWEARLTSRTDLSSLDCIGPLEQIPFVCDFVDIFSAAGTATVYEVRNGPADRYVGPLGEGAGRVHIGRAIAALRDGVVIYSAASGSGLQAGTGPRDLQGSWQVGVVTAGATSDQRFVVHAAGNAGTVGVTFAFQPGNPSDGTRAIPVTGPGAWTVTLPPASSVPAGGDRIVTFRLTVPAAAPAGIYSGVVLATTSQGTALRIPVVATVAMHDPNPALQNPPGPQAKAGLTDAFAKSDTVWPSVLGSTGTGASSDWSVYPVELATDLTRAVFSVADTASGQDTYDLYLYDARFDLVASTHPGAEVGVTDAAANNARGPTPPSAPQTLTIETPAGGRHYVVVNRAKIGVIGPAPTGSFGAFELTLDEIRVATPPRPTMLTYEGDFVWVTGEPARLAARLTDANGAPIAGRVITFTVDGMACPGGDCQATTDYDGLAQLATAPVALPPGVHEVRASFAGDSHWLPSAGDALVVVIGPGGPPGGGSGKVTAGGWFLPNGSSGGPHARVHFAFHATGSATGATGELRYRDTSAGLDLKLFAYTAMTVNEADGTATLIGRATDSAGLVVDFALTARDVDEPGRGNDTIRMQIPARGYDRSGTLGGGNIQLHK